MKSYTLLYLFILAAVLICLYHTTTPAQDDDITRLEDTEEVIAQEKQTAAPLQTQIITYTGKNNGCDLNSIKANKTHRQRFYQTIISSGLLFETTVAMFRLMKMCRYVDG